MDNITNVEIEHMSNSNYVIPYRMKYRQNGVAKIWDLITVHESVAIIIFHTEKKKLIFVKQFRPAVYFSSIPKDGFLMSGNSLPSFETLPPASVGVTLELCAGIIDKTKDKAKTAQSEVLEECGYSVPLDKFEQIITFRAGVGVSGEKQTMFYVEVDDSMKISEGGGSLSEGELIEVVEKSVEEVKEMTTASELNCPSGFLFGVTWFLAHKAPLITS